MKKHYIGITLIMVAVVGLSCMSRNMRRAEVGTAESILNAITGGDADALLTLLEAGLQVETQIGGEFAKTGWRMLHLAAISNRPEIAKLLMAHGATIDARDTSGMRPIDIAFREARTNICMVLERKPPPEKILAGIPSAIWEELQPVIQGAARGQRPIFISLNGTDPPPEFISWIRSKMGCNVAPILPRSQAVTLAWNDIPPEETQYRDKESGAYGCILELDVVRASSSMFTFRARSASAQALSGHGQSGNILNAYGYWIRVDQESWDE